MLINKIIESFLNSDRHYRITIVVETINGSLNKSPAIVVLLDHLNKLNVEINI